VSTRQSTGEYFCCAPNTAEASRRVSAVAALSCKPGRVGLRTQVVMKLLFRSSMTVLLESGPALRILPLPQHDSSSSVPANAITCSGFPVRSDTATAWSKSTQAISLNR
jgi:hypothetical protein